METIKYKFNSGYLAIMCSGCNVVLKTGRHFTEEELNDIQNDWKLPAQYCNLCTALNIKNSKNEN